MTIVVDKILEILHQKSISKKDFAKKLIDLNPKVGTKGEPPSERTIYLYLQGKREIKADLIPYIAEVLDIQEQELFKDNNNFYENTYIKEPTNNYGYSTTQKELIALLPYIPEQMIQNFIKKAKEIKKIALEDV